MAGGGVLLMLLFPPKPGDGLAHGWWASGEGDVRDESGDGIGGESAAGGKRAGGFFSATATAVSVNAAAAAMAKRM